MTMRTHPYPLKRPEPFLTGNLHPVWELPYEPLGASLPAHQSAHWGAIEALYYAAWCAREAGELETARALQTACGSMHQAFNQAYPEALRAMAAKILRQAVTATARRQ